MQCLFPSQVPQPDAQATDEPLQCTTKSQETQGDKTIVTLDCNGQETKVEYPSKQADPCTTCNKTDICQDNQCWPKGSHRNPGESCQSILESYKKNTSAMTPPSGPYWIKHPAQSSKRLKVYCDMETEEGGWTLCLNSRYTQESQSKLFTSTYKPVYPPVLPSASSGIPQESDPFGVYDFCPTDKTNYRMTLAKSPGLRYTHNIVDFVLSNATASEQSEGEERYRGVTSQSSKWVTRPPHIKIEKLSPPTSIRFWWNIKPSSGKQNVEVVFRGFAKIALPSSEEHVWMGAGCYNLNCSSPEETNFHDKLHDAKKATFQASYLSWKEGNPPDIQLKAFRVQVYYR